MYLLPIFQLLLFIWLQSIKMKVNLGSSHHREKCRREKKNKGSFKVFQILGRFLRSRFRGYIFDPIVSRLSWNTTWPSRLGCLFLSPQGLSFFHFFFLLFFFAADLPISFNRDALASVNEVGANGLPTLSLSVCLSSQHHSLLFFLFFPSHLRYSFHFDRLALSLFSSGLARNRHQFLSRMTSMDSSTSCLNEITYIYAYALVSYLSTISSNVRNWSEQIGTDRGHS